jgi:hypothetical protein
VNEGDQSVVIVTAKHYKVKRALVVLRPNDSEALVDVQVGKGRESPRFASSNLRLLKTNSRAVRGEDFAVRRLDTAFVIPGIG